MTENKATYIYGSAARELYAVPEYTPERERRQQPRPVEHVRPRPKTRIDKVAVILTCLTFVAVMVIGISYLHLQFQTTYLSKSVVNLQSEVVDMQKDNATARMELENSVDLSSIYEKATNEFGMKVAKENQIFTYHSKKSTQIRQYGEIPTT